MLAAALLKEPAPQSEHTPAPAALYWPMEQSTQAVEPDAADARLPAGHRGQLIAVAADAAAVPAPHAVQAVAPEALKRPGSHVKHALRPTAGPEKPA
jgi:hypothetical protein